MYYYLIIGIFTLLVSLIAHSYFAFKRMHESDFYPDDELPRFIAGVILCICVGFAWPVSILVGVSTTIGYYLWRKFNKKT